MSVDDSAVPRDRLNLAAGALMARHGLGSGAAYGLIMDRAWMTERSIDAVVDQVLHQTQRPHDADW